MRPTVPVIEGADDEKDATTTIDSLEYRGVRLESRYDKAHEYEQMLNMLEPLSEHEVRFVERIWCDSKATACYSIDLKCPDRHSLDHVADRLAALCADKNGGYNFMQFKSPAGEKSLDADWPNFAE